MEEDSGDEKLDVNNANFDPLLALYSDRVVIPRPDALVLDNVAKFESLHSNCKGSTVRIDQMLKSNQVKKKEPEPGTSKEVKPRFQVTQDSVSSKKKPIKNVLTRITDASGPLAVLRDCMEKRIRIKVWTRNATGIRGYCLGFVVAFDKHWNLAMCDVNEVWSRRTKRKTICLGKELEPPKQWKVMGPMVTPPKIVVLKTEKGIQTCERHVNQMLMRGIQGFTARVRWIQEHFLAMKGEIHGPDLSILESIFLIAHIPSPTFSMDYSRCYCCNDIVSDVSHPIRLRSCLGQRQREVRTIPTFPFKLVIVNEAETVDRHDAMFCCYSLTHLHTLKLQSVSVSVSFSSFSFLPEIMDTF